MTRKDARIYVKAILDQKNLENDREWNIGRIQMCVLLTKAPLRLIPALIRINEAVRVEHQRLTVLNKSIPRFLRVFPVVPQKSYHLHHVQFDSTSIYLLRNAQVEEINRKNKIRGVPKVGAVANNRLKADFVEPMDVFKMMFKVDDYKKTDSKNLVRQSFAGSFRTDGTSLSILIHKRVDLKPVSYFCNLT